jgi:DNA-binding Lrp family transcriptional regulator
MLSIATIHGADIRMKFGRNARMPHLDAVDKALLGELQHNARRTNRELAEAVHVSPSTSLERVRGLQAKGVIQGYRAEVALESIGRPLQALIAVRIRPPSRDRIEAFRDWVSGLPETIGVFVVSGTDDFLIHLGVRDPQHLYSFVIDRLTERPEIADVRTSLVYDHIRKPVLEVLE